MPRWKRPIAHPAIYALRLGDGRRAVNRLLVGVTEQSPRLKPLRRCRGQERFRLAQRPPTKLVSNLVSSVPRRPRPVKHESRLARGGFRIAGAGFEPATFGL